MFAKLLLKVTNIIKITNLKPTIVSAPAKLDVVEPKSIQLHPTVVSPTVVSPTVVSPTVVQITDEPTHSIVIFPCVRDPTSIKSQCKTCAGCGFIKTNSIICDTCDGIKCMACNSLGLSQLPWSECHICYGVGEIIHS